MGARAGCFRCEILWSRGRLEGRGDWTSPISAAQIDYHASTEDKHSKNDSAPEVEM